MEPMYDEAYEMTTLSGIKYTFIQDGDITRNGWCWMRLIKTDPTSDMRATLWRARRYWNVSFKEYRYTLHNPFGGYNDIPLKRVANV